MPQIADEIIVDIEIAFVDRRDERQEVHIFQDRALVVVNDDAGRIAIGQAGDLAPGPVFRHLLDGEIELVARDKIDRRRCLQAAVGIDRDLGADKSGLQARVHRFQRLDGRDVRGK